MINQIEKIIRKRWLYFYTINTILNFLFFVYFVVIKNYGIAMSDHPVVYWFSMLYAFSMIVLFAWVFFYFPYIKKGTKLLTIQLIFFPISIVWSIWGTNKIENYHWFWIVFSCIQGILFFYFSLNLLMVNKFNKLISNNKKEKAERIMEKLKKRFI